MSKVVRIRSNSEEEFLKGRRCRMRKSKLILKQAAILLKEVILVVRKLILPYKALSELNSKGYKKSPSYILLCMKLSISNAALIAFVRSKHAINVKPAPKGSIS
jgi:hypothetical protein